MTIYNTGYKVVVRSNDNKLHSYMFRSFKNVIYKKNEWISKPFRCGPLTYFNEYEAATRFIHIRTNYKWIINPNCTLNHNDKIEIWQCKVIMSQSLYNSLWYVNYPVSIKKANERDRMSLPLGTMLAEKIMLIEQINSIIPPSNVIDYDGDR